MHELSDIIGDFDNIPPRQVLDKSVNQHGLDLIEFLNDAKFCVLNGRCSIEKAESNNWTSISRRGRAVVDYICVPHDQYTKCTSFKVVSMQSIVDDCVLHGLLGVRSRLPDHSAIITEFTTVHSGNVGQSSSAGQEIRHERYKVRTVSDDFMDSYIARLAIINCISRIETCRETQCDMDTIYGNLCEAIKDEMNRNLPKYESRGTNKRYKTRKSYWNGNLSDLWKLLRERERAFLKCNDNQRVKTALRREYIVARDSFDKSLRQAERAYRRAKSIEIETMSTNNPNEFWDKINKLGPRSDKSIPCEIIDGAGNVVRDEQEVLNKWKRDFEGLCNGTDNSKNYRQAKVHQLIIENNSSCPLYTST